MNGIDEWKELKSSIVSISMEGEINLIIRGIKTHHVNVSKLK